MKEQDASSGYDAAAEDYIELRSAIGLSLVKDWAARLPHGGHVLDIGAGNGEPLTRALLEAGLTVTALDGSPKMAAAFRQNFPDVDIYCEAVQGSLVFDRQFDGILAIGLVFLLPEAAQTKLLADMARALKPNGRLLFSAPHQIHEWVDVLTGQTSRSLGRKAYQKRLEANGLSLLAEYEDDGGNHYYEAARRAGA